MKDLLLCGYGSIGKVLYNEFQKMADSFKVSCKIYDPYINELNNNFVKDLSGSYSIAFICVPTPSNEDGSCDNSIVLDTISKINADIIVIKSTVSLKILPELSKYNNIIFSPEYTSTNQHCGIQNYVVLGGERNLCNKVSELYKNIKPADFEIIYTDIKTAIMAKYMHNCYLALKVVFCSEFYIACKEIGIEYDDLKNIFIKDSRINPSHTNIINGRTFYDSHCFNKDIPAFIDMFKNVYSISLMESVNNLNKYRRSIYEIN